MKKLLLFALLLQFFQPVQNLQAAPDIFYGNNFATGLFCGLFFGIFSRAVDDVSLDKSSFRLSANFLQASFEIMLCYAIYQYVKSEWQSVKNKKNVIVLKHEMLHAIKEIKKEVLVFFKKILKRV